MPSLPLSTTDLVLASLIGFVAVGFWALNRHTHRAWKSFAARQGWAYTGSFFKLSVHGAHHGRAVSVQVEQRRQGGDPMQYTVARLDVRDLLPPGFTLKFEGVGSRLLKRLGATDEELGDEALDGRFELGHITPEVRAVLLTPAVREHLLSLRDDEVRYELRNGLLLAEKLGVPKTPEALEVFTGPVLDFGDALDTVPSASREWAEDAAS